MLEARHDRLAGFVDIARACTIDLTLKMVWGPVGQEESRKPKAEKMGCLSETPSELRQLSSGG